MEMSELGPPEPKLKNSGGKPGRPKRRYQHTCEKCGVVFESQLKVRRFCSKRCKDKFRRVEGELVTPHGTNGMPLVERKCLKCGAKFLSWGPGNRMCGPCRREPDRELGR